MHRKEIENAKKYIKNKLGYKFEYVTQTGQYKFSSKIYGYKTFCYLPEKELIRLGTQVGTNERKGVVICQIERCRHQ